MTSKERAYLRSLAQPLSPYVMVGKEGASYAVVSALSEALEIHELVKVRFVCFKEEVKELSRALERDALCTLIAVTGFTAVFYRQNPDPKKRKIVL